MLSLLCRRGEDEIPLYFLLKAFPFSRCAAAVVLRQKPAVTSRAEERAHICLQRRAAKGLGSPVLGDYVLVIDSTDCHGGKWQISQGTVRALHKYELACQCQPNTTLLN